MFPVIPVLLVNRLYFNFIPGQQKDNASRSQHHIKNRPVWAAFDGTIKAQCDTINGHLYATHVHKEKRDMLIKQHIPVGAEGGT